MAKKTKDQVPSGQAIYTVRTPSPVFAGDRDGLRFASGLATTTDSIVAAALRARGYQVSQEAEDAEPGELDGNDNA